VRNMKRRMPILITTILVASVITIMAIPICMAHESLSFEHFGVCLEYVVNQNGYERWGHTVSATVSDPKGGNNIESITTVDPYGRLHPDGDDEVKQEIENLTMSLWWWESLNVTPKFGTYTITATNKDGEMVTVTTWATDHVSNRVPTIIYPENHGIVESTTPTFRWEAFSSSTTGYLIEVTDTTGEEILLGDDATWRIGLSPDNLSVTYNSDGTAFKPELTRGKTYSLLVFASEWIWNENDTQSYCDTSIRHIEFTVSQPTVSISTDSFEYSPGDTMTITIDITNPTEESVMFQWYWGVPLFSVWLPVMSVPIPAGYDDTVDLSFTIPNWGLTPFGNVFYVHLLDAGGEVLDADCACWAYRQLLDAEGEVLDADCECWCEYWAYMQLRGAGGSAGGKVLDADCDGWAYSPSGEAMPAVDIGEKIMETIERVELP
jgi:hypothetical protein